MYNGQEKQNTTLDMNHLKTKKMFSVHETIENHAFHEPKLKKEPTSKIDVTAIHKMGITSQFQLFPQRKSIFQHKMKTPLYSYVESNLLPIR